MKPAKVEEKEYTVFVPVKARLSKWVSGQSFLAIDDDEIAKVWFMDKFEEGYDPAESFRNHLIMYNKVQQTLLDYYEKRAISFKWHGDRVLIICIYGIGLHFIFGVKKKAFSPKKHIDLFGMRVFFVNKWSKPTPSPQEDKR
jgi:hypothetical protein